MKRPEIFILLLVSCVESNVNMNNNTFYPRLPIGEYQAHVQTMLPCDTGRRNKIHVNYFISKVSRSSAEIQGNLTNDIPLDDTLHLRLHFDVKSSNGGWATNSVIFKKSKACSGLLAFIRENFHKNFGCNGTCACPLPAGVFFMRFPATNIEVALKNIPETFIYGTYRLRFIIMNQKNEEISCGHSVVDIKRPWEMP